jgi:hypothetical protein
VAAIDVRWLSIFADVPADRLDRSVAFWTAATAATPGRPAGERGEFRPLEPAGGDRWLWLQCLDAGGPGWHLDLHVPDIDAAGAAAVKLGAATERRLDDVLVLRSPAGLPFCLALEDAGRERRRAAPPAWPGGRSLVDQVCLDIPALAFDTEADFWSALTGWPRLGSADDRPVFDRLAVPERLPAQVLLQRLEPGADDPIHAHVDLSADDRDAEVARHLALGAEVVRRTEHWTTLRDPAGLVYCVTVRATGRRIS